MHRDYRGIKFYSVTDLSCWYNLEKSERIFQTFLSDEKYDDINKVIELFNVKLLINNGIRLAKWNDDEYENYKSVVKKFEKTIAIFFNQINDVNFIQYLEETDFDYLDNFWDLISRYKVYSRISDEVISSTIEGQNDYVRYILMQKSVVTHYSQTITNHLIASTNCVKSTELLTSCFLEDNTDTKQSQLHFPNELTGEMREEIIRNYILSNNTNSNCFRLIAEAQSSQDLPLKDKTRLEAQRKYNDYINEYFTENSGFKYGVQISFSETQIEEIIRDDSADNTVSISYSTKWIDENQDYPTLWNNFIYLFEYVDKLFRSTFVSQPSQFGVFERIWGSRGKRTYATGFVFDIMDKMSKLQMISYYRQLSRLNIKLESMFKWFFEEYLVEEFHATGFVFHVPSDGTTYLEKCKLLASEIDSTLKQFTMFVEDDNIDRELLEMSSKQVKFENVPSFCKEKYVYPNNGVCSSCMQLLCSDQSGIIYTEKMQSKYLDFFSLIKNEAMNIEDFFEYQKHDIEWLSQQGCINIGEVGELTLIIEKAGILRDLHRNSVSCLSYLDRYRTMLDSLLSSGEVRYESSLFSEPEQSYMNYILNKAEYSNGHDLRNKYIHSTHSLSPEVHQNDYIELLKIMVLIIIKINEEFCLQEKAVFNEEESEKTSVIQFSPPCGEN